jgi:hypothetical protein
LDLILAAIDAWGKGHSGLLLILALVAYMDLSLRLRFLEWVIKRRKVFTVGPVTIRERWLPWTSILQHLRRHKTIAIDNGHGRITEANIKDRRKTDGHRS